MDKLLNDFSPGLFVVQTILLLLLIFIMVKFAWKPILTSLNEREEGIQGALDAAENAKRDMENLQADNQKLLQEARLEREAMITDAETLAQEQANKIIVQAQLAIENEKKTAMAELKNHVANLSIDIAEKVVRQELSNKGKQLELVESMLAETKLN
jgi:F-type H+-transporting ATPase subunit b